MTEATLLQEQLAYESDGLLRIRSRRVELPNRECCRKSQSVAGDTILEDLKHIPEAREFPTKCAKVMHRCEDPSPTPLTAT